MFRYIPSFIFLLIFAIFVVAIGEERSVKEKNIVRNIPSFSFKTIDNPEEVITENDIQKENVTIINFFASWCVACVVEHPELLKLSQEEDIEIIGVAWKDDIEKTKLFLKNHGNPYDILVYDQHGENQVNFGLIGIPETLLIINKKIVKRYRGIITSKKILKEIDSY